MSGKNGKDREEDNPFRRSSKLQRSPAPKLVESNESPPESETDRGTRPQKKRKEISPGIPGTSKSQKVSHADSDSDMSVEESDDGKSGEGTPFQQRHSIISDMLRWSQSQYKSKKLTISQINDVKKNMNTLTELLSGIERRQIRLEGRLEGRKEILEMIKEAPGTDKGEFPKARSYAEVSAAQSVPKITGAKRQPVPPKVVFIKSRDDSKDIEEVKKMIQTTINPKDLGIKVRRVVKTARGVMIETDRAEQLQKLQNCEALKTKGLVIEAPKKRCPKVMIYDMDGGRDEKEIIEDVYAQNVDDVVISKEDFIKEFQCVHKYTSRNREDTRANWVVECSPRVRNELRQRDRLFVGWQSCRIKDYNPVVRCYKCLMYGHISKHCRGKQVSTLYW